MQELREKEDPTFVEKKKMAMTAKSKVPLFGATTLPKRTELDTIHASYSSKGLRWLIEELTLFVFKSDLMVVTE